MENKAKCRHATKMLIYETVEENIIGKSFFIYIQKLLNHILTPYFGLSHILFTKWLSGLR